MNREMTTEHEDIFEDIIGNLIWYYLYLEKKHKKEIEK
jgi:hypothetical protein